MISFYKRQIIDLKPWLFLAAVVFITSFVFGFFLYIIKPGLASHFADALKEISDKVSKDGKIQLTWQSVIFVFRQNFNAALLAAFGGFFLGLPTLFIGATNFILIGFLAGVSYFSATAVKGLGIFHFLILTVPHGIFEISAILIAVGLGLKLGFFWLLPKNKGMRRKAFWLSLKQIFVMMPLVAVLLFIAATIEIFVTGNISALLY